VDEIDRHWKGHVRCEKLRIDVEMMDVKLVKCTSKNGLELNFIPR
jgi:hypothetical protein